MKYFRFIILAIAGIVVCSCAAKYKQPGTITISVTELKSTKAKVTIQSSNPEAYFSIGLISEDMDTYYQMTDEENARFQMDFFVERWQAACDEAGKTVSFTDLYCYKGTNREHRYTYLNPDTHYKVIAFQVDPDLKQYIGKPVSVIFHTNDLTKSDITFDFKFEADKVTIIPSNNDPYYWDYILDSEMEAEYADAKQYYEQLILMYEEYGFMGEGATDRGTVEWVFSRDDTKPMEEGQKYTLVASGYANGEINSYLTIIQFIYHRDKACEQIILLDRTLDPRPGA